MSKETVTFVTGNATKVAELAAAIGNNFPLHIKHQKLDLSEHQGEIEEVAVKKCQNAARILKTSVLIDDSSLCFNAWNGLPGPYIKWFLQKLGPEGLTKSLAGWEDKTAEAVCTFAYCTGDSRDSNVLLFQGRTKGTIVEPRGSKDSGWDCIFQPEGYCKTFAELTMEEKKQVTDRFKAVDKLCKHFNKEN